jgi:3-hydroxybutyryl-CoA dehydrogenase
MLIDTGGSRSFPEPHAALDAARRDDGVALLIGADAGVALDRVRGNFGAVLVELGTECLAVHGETPNLLGFARFRLGNDPPSPLVELVRLPNSAPEAVEAAKSFFAGSGLEVALCNDFAGRIIDRLIRPYFNAALKRLDEGLATAADLDLTLRLGLGYPEGPIALLERSGLAQHFAVSQALFEAYGETALVPARRARVAFERRRRE